VRTRCDEPAPDALVRGIEQFNAREFFEQHETLETLWRDTRTPVRDLYHGILQIGVGLHHWRSGNFHGATVLIDEGLARLGPFAPRCHGIDIERLMADTTALRARLGELGASRMSEIDLDRDAPRVGLST